MRATLSTDRDRRGSVDGCGPPGASEGNLQPAGRRQAADVADTADGYDDDGRRYRCIRQGGECATSASGERVLSCRDWQVDARRCTHQFWPALRDIVFPADET